MEHIKEILGRLKTEKPTPGQKISGDEMSKPTREELREELRWSLNVSSLDCTFDNFKPVKGTGVALRAFRALASGKVDWWMLLCYGGVGNGKTYLCEATAIELRKRGIFCRVLTMTRIVAMLKRSMERYAVVPFEDAMSSLCNNKYLIIDDIGVGSSGTSWALGQLEEIIVARYKERLFTILSSNLDIEFDKKYPDLPFIPVRIVSRFRDPDAGRVVLNEGEDYRGLKGKSNSNGTHKGVRNE